MATEAIFLIPNLLQILQAVVRAFGNVGHTQMKTKLAKGNYAVVVFVKDGPNKLDEHRIEVAGHGSYLLNVLGSQTYFLGEAVYGALESPPPKVIQEKWFEFGRIDYMFQDP